MSPTLSLAGDFDRAIRERGADYFRRGRVRIDSATASHLRATVRGSSRYRVGMTREGNKVRVVCTCPYFDVDLCKHIWAVIMAAENQPLLESSGRRGIQLVYAGGRYFDDWDESDDDEDVDSAVSHGPARIPAEALKAPPKPRATHWRQKLAQLDAEPDSGSDSLSSRQSWPATRQLLYAIDVTATQAEGAVRLEVLFRDRKRDGGWGKVKGQYLPGDLSQRLSDPADRHIMAALAEASGIHSQGHRFRLIDPQPQSLLPVMCKTGRCVLSMRAMNGVLELIPVTWEEGEPWQLRLEVRASGERYEMTGALWRGSERMALTAPLLMVEAGIVFTREKAARYEHHGAFNWIRQLRAHGSLSVPVAQGEEFLAALLRQPRLPPLQLPQELRYEEISVVPRPRLAVKPDRDGWGPRESLRGELSFDYGEAIVAHETPGRGVVQSGQRRVLLRDAVAEQQAQERLMQLGWRQGEPGYRNSKTTLALPPRLLPQVVRELAAEGWHVEAEGRLYRAAGKFNLQVQSGIDWFELHGTLEFGNATAGLPELLAAARSGERLVKLDDGTFGLLPEDWLRQYGLLAGLGVAHRDHLRFKRSQVVWLDALLAAQPQVKSDAVFLKATERLRRFAGIEPVEPPPGFKGELRPYQKEGLGWFHFLRDFGFGGCLADDMGLGKTVQVLALLEQRRQSRGRRSRCSLVVVPKSLIFNWRQEAARFAPRLKALDYTGVGRRRGRDHFENYDLILTTYGTLRNDAASFKEARFDYVVLDEAQAIKNADSVSAKAVRLLQAEHRLALSGTPIENHLGELWSLFEFLNPGMLGAGSLSKLTHAGLASSDAASRGLLARAMRPFLLRRTKEQVLKDLPPKVEQTLYCELESRQRKFYDELREHYRRSLLKRVDSEGIKRSKIEILTALLRLRQAALHPGLIDEQRAGESSAKLDMLLPQLREVLEEGHKTLVFSQFTGMLAILRECLDREGIAYEYLDGRTRDRQSCVSRFQSDPDRKLFLISLKAGGLGLNLTAAQYVFLLDPWWNPAVEAQAIDRAHRIGQVNRVFAYRLIARDTVEEKVVALQSTKRELADAIVSADNALIRDLKREDLELLLS